VQCFADIFEHSPWISQRAYATGLSASANTAGGIMDAFSAVLDSASEDEKLALINAHPDLAGKLAMAKALTPDSTNEQASAGLDHLSDKEVARFTELNDAYKARFNFPFIMAIKGAHKDDILAAFESRLQNDQKAEYKMAIEQIKKIASLRLADRLP